MYLVKLSIQWTFIIIVSCLLSSVLLACIATYGISINISTVRTPHSVKKAQTKRHYNKLKPEG